jgi:hypothetical protein
MRHVYTTVAVVLIAAALVVASIAFAVLQNV